MRITLLTILLITFNALGQNPIDVLGYDLKISVNDTSDIIYVSEKISIQFTNDCEYFELDLATQTENGKGMIVNSILEYSDTILFEHLNDKLRIYTKKGKKNALMNYAITYQGIPKDGLVISKNKHDNRTFFGDNWPNRAHNWIACIDHPSDKAKVKFNIHSPSHYTCVANGKSIGTYPTDSNYTTTIYSSDIELPIKVIVFGLADFVHEEVASNNDFPITSWVYQEDEKAGFNDLRVATDPLNFFIDKIGPYPFEKLANVQSTTRFGGMENASCIFYDENAVTGKNKMENLIAHEIAHQWFGNTVTESDWPHLWLSEGFATYLTNLHIEQKYGREKMNEQLKADRKRIILFGEKIQLPVIDTITTDLMRLLNPNSYQKGSWTLHMLRNKIGEDTFWSGIRKFYSTYKYSNASSDDFIEIMSLESKMDLKPFFNQWLRRSDIPELKVTVINKCGKKIIQIEQVQKGACFSFPLEVITRINGKDEKHILLFTDRVQKIEIKAKKKEELHFVIDPNVNLLFIER